MKITILGTGTPTPSLKRASSGNLVEVGDILMAIDHGPGASRRLLESGHRATEVSHVFFSHLHYDHCMECPHPGGRRGDGERPAELDRDLHGWRCSRMAGLPEAERLLAGPEQVLNRGTFIQLVFPQLDPNASYPLRVAGILNGFDAEGDWHGEYQGSVAITPLPGALALFLTAIAGLGFAGWRRARAQERCSPA